ncbi:gamma-type small acid-soluble spore protein [Priestia endophytica]|uniref:gamma-type small acid-soluble spore protein n=1 Tax=Priestia endophytica TaxID=135735 RepID=UPI000DCA7DB5|nr:gamma-type small acid-soluble spore protein [Priestia endophytica]RAS82961.1 gamma-type small acid-soluble spore protein [Priestia endophytica]
MAKKNQNQTTAGTNVQHVKQQNAQSQNAQANQGQFGTEFASETDVQHVKQQNAQANKNKNQNS